MFSPKFIEFIWFFIKPLIKPLGAILGVGLAFFIGKSDGKTEVVTITKDVVIQDAQESQKLRNDLNNLNDSDLSHIVFFNPQKSKNTD